MKHPRKLLRAAGSIWKTVLIPRLRTGLAVLNKMGLTEREDMELRDVYQRGVEFFDKLFDGPVPQANTTTSH